ncbi:MAG: HNH endonuclease [Parvibaculum sp.]|uniref:HNH endonuclease n=1 Tax=Parvibaculum sp. TaxID=2024848 RepID=UPI003C7566B4
MTKAVLTSKITPTYDDLPEERYHFPKTYLRQIEAALHDWIVYYEPRRSSGDLSSSGGRQAYFATARITHIQRDANQPDHYYAFVSDYIEFDKPVPFAEGGFYYERILKKGDGSTNRGAFGRAVRNLSDTEYDRILQAGFAHILGEEPRTRPAPDVPEEPQPLEPGFAESHTPWQGPNLELATNRPVIERLIARPFRERAFATSVKAAYRDTCAMTGIKIINGGGRSEVQAAHIRPVANQGPDSIRNGIALSGTMHWMFDRGLVSVDDDYTILTAKDRIPDTVNRLLVESGKLLLPASTNAYPHPQFLSYHRQHVFKG